MQKDLHVTTAEPSEDQLRGKLTLDEAEAVFLAARKPEVEDVYLGELSRTFKILMAWFPHIAVHEITAAAIAEHMLAKAWAPSPDDWVRLFFLSPTHFQRGEKTYLRAEKALHARLQIARNNPRFS